MQASYKVAEFLYKQQNTKDGNTQAGDQSQQGKDGNDPIDADFKEKK